MSYKPDGYTSVAPYLIVPDAAATIRFLQHVFGATPLGAYPDGHGRLMHAEVRIDDTVLMLADSAPEWPPVPASVHVYVPDVDAVHAKAVAFGAESVQTPVQKDDDDKRGGVKDAGGTTWWIGTRVGPPARA